MIGELAQWALRRRRVFRVRGASMEPKLRDGELVLIDPAATAALGDIVVCGHPFTSIDVVKRVTAIDDGLLTLQSPHGTDSRQFGRVPVANVRGRVTASITRLRVV